MCNCRFKIHVWFEKCVWHTLWQTQHIYVHILRFELPQQLVIKNMELMAMVLFSKSNTLKKIYTWILSCPHIWGDVYSSNNYPAKYELWQNQSILPFWHDLYIMQILHELGHAKVAWAAKSSDGNSAQYPYHKIQCNIISMCRYHSLSYAFTHMSVIYSSNYYHSLLSSLTHYELPVS